MMQNQQGSGHGQNCPHQCSAWWGHLPKTPTYLHRPSLNLVDYLLFINRDVGVHPNPDEVADIKYVKREELKELLRKANTGEEGLKLSSWFRLVVDNFLPKCWDHVEKGTLNEAAVDMKTIHKLLD